MVDGWYVPELGHNFRENFAVMLIDYIYDNWSYTSLTGNDVVLNKPASKVGQYMEFRTGIKDDYKSLQVVGRQGRTVVVKHEQAGWKRELMTTQIWVTTVAKVLGMGDVSNRLRLLDQEIGRVCGMYIQANSTGEMAGIKDLIYEGNDRIYGPKEDFSKSDWESAHSVLMFYELVHAEQ